MKSGYISWFYALQYESSTKYGVPMQKKKDSSTISCKPKTIFQWIDYKGCIIMWIFSTIRCRHVCKCAIAYRAFAGIPFFAKLGGMIELAL